MLAWHDFEEFCDVCGSSAGFRMQTVGESVYCSTKCRRLERFLRNRTNKYGITPATFRRMLTEQHGKCAICLAPLGEFSHSENLMHIDHDHASGKVRGLLCGRCNRGIGAFRDDASALQRAAAYLTRQRESAEKS
jgi:hypothetical protein